MSSIIPNYGASLPKQYRDANVGDIPALDIKSLFRMILLGPSYSGKNNAVFFILKHSPHVFAHLHIIAKNPDQELYNYLKDKLDGFITIYDDAPAVQSIRKTPMNSNKPELVIIDDYSNDKKLQRDVFSHYFTRGRHFKLSTIFLAHSYFGTEKIIRLNSEYIGILKTNSKRDLQMVVRDFNIPNLTDDGMYKYYDEATKNRGQILFIDSVKQQIRYNFDRVIEIKKETNQDV